MNGIETLLLAIDDSRESEDSVPTTLRLAQSTGATTVLLHVTELPETPAHEADARKASEERLAPIQSEFPGATRIRVEKTGDPVQGILDAAEHEHADIIIVATHARTGLAGFTEGSVAYDLAAAGRVPVLLVPIPEADE